MRKPLKRSSMRTADDEAKLIATYLCEFADAATVAATVAANSVAMHEARLAASHLCRFKIDHTQLDHLANTFRAAALISELQRRKQLLFMNTDKGILLLVHQQKKARLDQLKQMRNNLTNC